jgi:hypothetical protein
MILIVKSYGVSQTPSKSVIIIFPVPPRGAQIGAERRSSTLQLSLALAHERSFVDLAPLTTQLAMIFF